MLLEYEVKKNRASIYDSVGSLLSALLFIIFSICFYERGKAFALLTIILSFRFSIYQMLDLWFDKKIVLKNSKMYIQCGGVKFKLNCQKTFLRIDNMFVLSPINAKFPTLNIYRNEDSILGKIFKNKIKLYVVTQNNLIAAKEEAKIISEMFNIPVYSDYDFE